MIEFIPVLGMTALTLFTVIAYWRASKWYGKGGTEGWDSP